MEMKSITLQMAAFKGIPKSGRLVHFAKVSLQLLKMVLSSLRLYACLSRYAPNEMTNDVLRDLLVDLDQGHH